MHRILAVLLSVMLLAGCSSTVKNPAPADPKSEKPVEMVLYTTLAINREALDGAIEAYTAKHPGTKIRVKEVPTGQMMTQDGTFNTAALEYGDMALLDDRMTEGFYEAGKLRDLSAVRLPQPAPGLENVLEELGRMEGKRMGLPVMIAPSMIAINETAFTNAGLKVPPLDWKVEDFEQTLRDLKAAGATYNLSAMFLADPLVRAYGGQMYDSAKQAWAFDTAEAKQGLSALGRLTRDKLVEGEVTGKRTIMIGGGPKGPALSMLPSGISAAMRGMNLMPLPKGPKGRAVPVGATMGSVLTSSANPEAATDFLKAMISDPAMQQAMARSGIRPVSNDSKALAAWQEAVGERMAQVVELSLQGAYVENTSTPPMADALTGLLPFLTGTTALDQIIPGLISSLK